MQSFLERFLEFIKSRLFIMLLAIFVLFSTIGIRLFSLQIINGETYSEDLNASIVQELTIPASRGLIYDRYGRPLAENQVAFSVMLDDSINVSFSDRNRILEEFVTYFPVEDGAVTDTLPITKNEPYEFTFATEEEELQWKELIGIKDKEATASETYSYLLEMFEINSNLESEYQRKIISLGLDVNDRGLMLLSLINVLDNNQEILIDDVPISATQPYVFLYDGNTNSEISWKQSVGMKNEELQYNGEKTVEYLVEFFDIPTNISAPIQRKMITLHYSLYLKRYRKYQPVTVAVDIKEETIAEIEENNNQFPGVTIETSSSRVYPEGKYFSHILGYIRKISEQEYEELKELGYSNNDIVGKSGVEKLYETNLNGVDGEMIVEVDVSGRRISTIETKPPIAGDDVFLTIDKDLQISTYEYLEDNLSDVLIKKLTATSASAMPITTKDFLSSMVECDTVSIGSILRSKEGVQGEVSALIYESFENFSLSSSEDVELAREFVINGINNNIISTQDIMLILFEQGKITDNGNYIQGLQNGYVSPLTVIINKLREKELTPGDTNLDPSTGSAVVTDINTGEVLALVTYPSYDNNKFVNNFDNDYYYYLLNHPSTPLVNRALSERKAPGSTFKMVSSLALLEEGFVEPYTEIVDLGIFTDAGTPHARCWIYAASGATHGPLNVSEALEVSCNYYYYDSFYRLGNATNGKTEYSIAVLNEYADALGLNGSSGIELGDSSANTASPAYKESLLKWQNPDVSESLTRWTDGDTIRAVIGQSVNNFAPIHMNKYISTLANGGTKYSSFITDRIESSKGEEVINFEPEVELESDFQEENLEAIYEGMRLVSEGSRGTLRGVFANFPITVASKSGTAQENLARSSHAWYTGFAPYEDPQIAVTVMMPYGDYPGAPSAVVGKEIIGEYLGLNYSSENSYFENTLTQ